MIKWNKCETGELMKVFHTKAYPERKELCQLAKSLNTSFRRVERWFSNMRYRKVAEGMLLESEYCSVMYDSL